MWLVRIALRRPYTFVVMAMLIVILGVVTIGRMPTDIFPDIDIPVISIVFNYPGLSPEEMEKRIVTNFERMVTTVVNDIEHVESQSITGMGVVKLFLQPGASVEGATAQVTAAAQTAVRMMPPGTTPPLIMRYSASNVPILQLALESESLSEQQLFDLGTNFIRNDIATVRGAQIPWPYGGKQRQIMIDIDPQRLYAWGLSPRDVDNAVNVQNVILPTGTVKIGAAEYPIVLNATPEVLDEISAIPIKTVGNTPVYVRDVASVRDGYAPQTSLVHVEGKKSVLMSVLKQGSASTLDVVRRIRDLLPTTLSRLPKDLKVALLFDQSLFVRAAVEGVVKEAAIAAGLTALMLLLFLGSWRSTLIVLVSIPLSILVSIIALSLLGQTLNVMTLGGMSLAVGILVDDATVEIENVHRNLAKGRPIIRAILDGAAEIAVPAFVSTLCICIVFVPVVFITGSAKSLFVPLALAVVFAMLTSYSSRERSSRRLCGTCYVPMPTTQFVRSRMSRLGLLRALRWPSFSWPSSAVSTGSVTGTEACSPGRFPIGRWWCADSSYSSWARSRSCLSSAAISFRLWMRVSSSCTCGVPPGRGSRRAKSGSRGSRRPSGRSSRPVRSKRCSTTSVCRTAASTFPSARGCWSLRPTAT